jgi:hypothetical protein
MDLLVFLSQQAGLVFLSQQAGQVVTKDQILERVPTAEAMPTRRPATSSPYTSSPAQATSDATTKAGPHRFWRRTGYKKGAVPAGTAPFSLLRALPLD